MQVTIQTHAVEITDFLKKLIDRKVGKLNQRFESAYGGHGDALKLTVALTRSLHRNQYVAELTLKVPRKVFHAEKATDDPISAVTSSFDALIRDAERYKFMINRSLRAKRMRLRATQRSVLTTEEETASQEMSENARQKVFSDAVRNRLASLYNFARREVLHHQLSGDLEPGDISPIELVNEAIVNVFEKSRSTFSEKEIEHLLYKEVWDILQREIDEVKASRAQSTSVEKIVENMPVEEEPAAGGFSGDELFEYWEPEEVLHLEDVLPESTFPTQEQILEDGELQNLLVHALVRLPEIERRAFVLSDVEGFQLEEIALILSVRIEEIEDIVNAAREKVKKELMEVSLKFGDADLREWYSALSRLPYSEEVERRLQRILSS
ncbi:MAG: HPF/RaiA family ribosome-associated protein [Bacteroidota bacterium]